MKCKKSYNNGENNPIYGRKHSSETIKKMKECKLGKLNPIWKGDKVGMSSLHTWVRKRLPVPELCQRCNLVEPYDLANVTGNYTRGFENWQYLCRRCHMLSDNRLENMRKAKKLYQIKKKQIIEDRL